MVSGQRAVKIAVYQSAIILSVRYLLFDLEIKMLAQQFHSQTAETTRTQLPVWPVATVLLGVAFALAAGALFPQLTGVAFVALWVLGFAAAASSIAFVGGKTRGELLWSYLIGGQVLALFGVVLLLAA